QVSFAPAQGLLVGHELRLARGANPQPRPAHHVLLSFDTFLNGVRHPPASRRIIGLRTCRAEVPLHRLWIISTESEPARLMIIPAYREWHQVGGLDERDPMVDENSDSAC